MDKGSLSIGFIGGGNMAASIIGGLLSKGFDASNITASDPDPQALTRLTRLGQIQTTRNNESVVAQADVIVLAVKPQAMASVLEPLRATVAKQRPLVISIAAGITVAAMQRWLGDRVPVVRCMPNTPALIGYGATALYASAEVSKGQQDQALKILSAVGIAEWVDSESQLDAVTALSGSGPAYFFLLMEIMQQCGRDLGLPDDLADKLTLQTALGAAQMAANSDVDCAELRRRVTSPGGTTESALNALEDGAVRELFSKALQTARDRSVQLAIEIEQDAKP